jgi:hypothetical protein
MKSRLLTFLCLLHSSPSVTKTLLPKYFKILYNSTGFLNVFLSMFNCLTALGVEQKKQLPFPVKEMSERMDVRDLLYAFRWVRQAKLRDSLT